MIFFVKRSVDNCRDTWLAQSTEAVTLFFFLIFFFKVFIYFWDRDRQSMSRGGAEREGDTEPKAAPGCQHRVRHLINWATQAPLEPVTLNLRWLVECATLSFDSGHDPRVVGSSHMSGSALSMKPAWDSLFLPLPSSLIVLSLSKIKGKKITGL